MLADNKQIDKRTTMRNQNRSAALGRPAMKLLVGGGLQLVCGRPTLALTRAVSMFTQCCSTLDSIDSMLFKSQMAVSNFLNKNV